MDNVQFVAVASIRVSQKQAHKVSEDKVSRHCYAIERGEDVYPVDLRAVGDGTFTIAGNGRHRYFAYIRCGYTHIPAIVRC